MEITKREQVAIKAIFFTLIYLFPTAFCGDGNPIPADITQVETWFQQNVQPVGARGASLDPALVAAEAQVQVIKLNADGSGQFRTLTDAVKSVPIGNTKRVIIALGPGAYREKVKIERGQNFITIVGDKVTPSRLEFGGTAKQYGTFYSATLTVEAEYFSAVNVHFVNTAPRPNSASNSGQAVAMRIGGDKASFYHCRFIGFQDTLCDDTGRHFFKDCYIEGTVDFIFGSGRSMYLNTEVHIIPGDPTAVATAQGGETKISNSGYTFVHCKVTGQGQTGFLGRAWRQYPQVVFSFCELSDAINPAAWSNNQNPANDATVFYGEYKNVGPRATMEGRYPYLKKITDLEAKSFISLEYILGSTWLLPAAIV